MLGVEGSDLGEGEVGQRERFDLDVEGAGGAQALGDGGGDAVVADIAQADQRQRPGERGRPISVAVAELTQDRDERLILQRVNFVEEDDERSWAGFRPGRQSRTDALATVGGWPGRRLEVSRQARVGRASPGAQEGEFGRAWIVGEGRADLQ